MNTKAIGIALSIVITGGALAAAGVAAATASKLPWSVHANAHAMRLDRCPYYPSPVACRSPLGTRTTSDSLIPAHSPS